MRQWWIKIEGVNGELAGAFPIDQMPGRNAYDEIIRVMPATPAALASEQMLKDLRAAHEVLLRVQMSSASREDVAFVKERIAITLLKAEGKL